MTNWHYIVPLSRSKRLKVIDFFPEPKRLKTIDHKEYEIHASIRQLSENHFEVLYYGDFDESQECGWSLEPPVDLLTKLGKTKFMVLTFANSLPAAESIANIEIEMIIDAYRNDSKLSLSKRKHELCTAPLKLETI